MCVCVCVCGRESESEREGLRGGRRQTSLTNKQTGRQKIRQIDKERDKERERGVGRNLTSAPSCFGGFNHPKVEVAFSIKNPTLLTVNLHERVKIILHPPF